MNEQISHPTCSQTPRVFTSGTYSVFFITLHRTHVEVASYTDTLTDSDMQWEVLTSFERHIMWRVMAATTAVLAMLAVATSTSTLDDSVVMCNTKTPNTTGCPKATSTCCPHNFSNTGMGCCPFLNAVCCAGSYGQWRGHACARLYLLRSTSTCCSFCC